MLVDYKYGCVGLFVLLFDSRGLLVFRSGSDGDSSGSAIAPTAVVSSGEVPLELAPENPDPENPGSDFTGSAQSPFDGITRGGIDPDFLIAQLEMAGVEIPDGASTEELADLLDEAVLDGFIGFAP